MSLEIDKKLALAILESLRALEAPSRKIDTDIALLIGFEKYGAEKVVWLHPETRKEAKVPRYTSLISAAFDFAQMLVPENVGGCAWENGLGSAKIEPGPPFQAPNPAIALCMCALYVNLSASKNKAS
jgi:hypothetical protein